MDGSQGDVSPGPTATAPAAPPTDDKDLSENFLCTLPGTRTIKPYWPVADGTCRLRPKMSRILWVQVKHFRDLLKLTVDPGFNEISVDQNKQRFD